MKNDNTKTKVIVGLSGGVDSSVAALLLQQQGYLIEGLFMKNWEGDDSDDYCSVAQDLADAKAVCAKLQIPFHSVNFAKDYWDKVFSQFLQEYQAGRTPNPDILCNKEIKFKAFLDYAMQLGADYIATGHYVRCQLREGEYALLKGLDANKDQSYFLYTLGQTALAKSLFPVGELQKSQVREIAEQAGFINHAKKDSTGICFIGERKFKDFLSEYLLAQPGAIETPEGECLGEHSGLMYYTLGQRQGLGIGGRADNVEAPWYVVAKDTERNVLVVAQGHDHPLLFAQGLRCNQLHWTCGEPGATSLRCVAKTRYRQVEQACTLEKLGSDSYQVTFDEKQRAITPGQSVVFYHQEECLGGGVIDIVH